MAALNIVDFIKIFYRSFFIQATWNYERRQGLGYCFCLLPFAKKYLSNKSDRVEFLKRNLEFFNSHPYMVNWIIGAALKMEQQSLQKQEVASAQIDQFKTHMSVVAAAIGDQMFWSQIKPLSAMVGVVLTLYFQLIGLVAFLVVYNVPHLYVRIKGLWLGYEKGFELTKSFAMKKYKPMINALNKTGGLFTGILLIFMGNSKYVTDSFDVLAFAGGIGFMICFLKLKLSIPMALTAVIILSSTIAAIIL